ncbi:MAG: helix-turn-helix domain-containing protein [Planctomycetota bacterium]
MNDRPPPDLIPPDRFRRAALAYADRLELVPFESQHRAEARQLLGDAAKRVAWPHDADPRAERGLCDLLFVLGWQVNLRSGPLPELARRLRGLLDLVAPEEAPPEEPEGSDSPVLTPEQAAAYLGLDRLGVKNPASRVRYLVKKGRLRSTKVLGRLAFTRADLDEYLARCGRANRRSASRAYEKAGASCP